METRKCETECREELIEKMDDGLKCKIDRSSMLRIAALVVTILIALMSIGFAISGKGIDRREKLIEANAQKSEQVQQNVNDVRERLIRIEVNQENVQESIRGMQEVQKEILRELKNQ